MAVSPFPVALALMLLLQLPAVFAQVTGDVYYVFKGSEHRDGISLTWNSSTGSTRSLNLTGVHLPLDVQQTYNGILLRRDDADGSLYIDVPVLGGLLSVQLTSDFMYKQHSVITWPISGSLPCQPIAVYRGSPVFSVFTPCINRTEQKLWFPRVLVESDNISTWTLTPPSQLLEFDNLTAFFPTTIAHVCPGYVLQHYLFFMSGRDVYAYLSADGQFGSRGSVSENCSEPFRLKQDEHNPGTVMVHCKGYYTEVIDYCNAEALDSVAETPVRCSSDVTASLTSSGVSISEVGSNHTSFINVDLGPEGAQDALCVTADQGAILVLVLANSSVVVVDLSTQEVSHLGSTCTDDNWCPIPQVQGDRYMLHSNGTNLLLVDIDCLDMPVRVENGVPDVSRLYITRPDQLPVLECLGPSPMPLPSPMVVDMSSTPLPSPMVVDTSPTPLPSPMVVDGDGDSSGLSAGQIGGITAAAVVVVALTTLGILACLVCWWKNRKKRNGHNVRVRYNQCTHEVTGIGCNQSDPTPTGMIPQRKGVPNSPGVKGHSTPDSKTITDTTQLGHQSDQGSIVPPLPMNGTTTEDLRPSPDPPPCQPRTSEAQVVLPAEDPREAEDCDHYLSATSDRHELVTSRPVFTVGSKYNHSEATSDGSEVRPKFVASTQAAFPPALRPTHGDPSNSEAGTLTESPEQRLSDYQHENVSESSTSAPSLSFPLSSNPFPHPHPQDSPNGYIPSGASAGGHSTHTPVHEPSASTTPSERTSSSVPYLSSSSDQQDLDRTNSHTPDSASGPYMYVTPVAPEDTALRQNPGYNYTDGAALTPTVIGHSNPLSHRAASDTQVVNIMDQRLNPNDPQYADQANERQRVLNESARRH